jgi:hypothetical protein
MSINDRLGGKPGKDIAPLSDQWMYELSHLAREFSDDKDSENASILMALRQALQR